MPAMTHAATNARRWLIAAFRSARNIATDLRYGQFTAVVPGRHGDTNNSDHKVLEAVFEQQVRPGDVIVDVGCGRGRVLAHLLRYYPDHQVIGIEIDQGLAATTARRFRGEARCEVIAGDAVSVLPTDATLMFLFNPFGEDDIERLRATLEARPPTAPPQRLLYSNPRHLDGFDSSDAWSVRRKTLGGGRLVPFHDLAVVDRVP